ncbi:DUF4188 domain-containing protein [Actinomycetospora endophytica]|uniref:DUF4188 domain-containing protein n=1 Tax=Actinomycetospora endophytica TaxID=2291215 RepID=A0ABS8P3C3_9PSEU|nr:DUF4188 domain-containing protein [Actinomycetospora endophytica]MCD2192750.1 DUF4188 domain-containing protein [Actinomycetospora endophytica]
MSPYVRRSAEIEGDFVVFVIGTHINRWRDVRAWLPVARAMPRMIRELEADPSLGLLKAYGGWLFGGPAYIQYWRSYEQLTAYARSGDAEHLPAWRAFNRAARRYPDSVGIFHETYRVSAGQWETIYGAMPEIGLLGASRGADLRRGSTSASRMGTLSESADIAPVAAPVP